LVKLSDLIRGILNRPELNLDIDFTDENDVKQLKQLEDNQKQLNAKLDSILSKLASSEENEAQ